MAERSIQIRGFDKLARKFAKLGKSITDVRIMGQIGSFINFRIKERTSRGVNIDERRFPPYSAQYAKHRRDTGHPVSNVNLFFTGSMFASLTYEAERDQVTSFFMNTVDKFGGRNPQKAFFNDQLRPFFGLNDRDITDIERILMAHIGKELGD